MSYLGYKMLKSEFDNDKALEIAAWCNETQSATWQDMGDYYECVEVEPPAPRLLEKLEQEYLQTIDELKNALAIADLRNDTTCKKDLQAEFADLQDWYLAEKQTLEGGE